MNKSFIKFLTDFGPLLIKGKVIPPVITEATDIYNLEDSTTIRTSDRIYQIKNQARFSSIAPTWRAYMQFPFENKAYSSEVYVSKALMPENETERATWLAATVKGWDSGVEQANTMLENNLKRLNRDYIGMVRFHEFVIEGIKTTIPFHRQLMEHPDYISGDYTTKFMEDFIMESIE
mgnify:CR=1 FL=1